MKSETNLNLLEMWQEQKSEDIQMSLEELRLRAVKFERKIYWRNAREYVAVLIVTVWFSYLFWQAPDGLTGTGCALIIAGMLYVMWQLHRRGSSRALPGEIGSASGVEFYKRELERQRDLVRGVWRWYLAPLVPGLAVLGLAKTLANPHHWPHYGWVLAGYILFVAAGFVWILRLNARVAGRLQRCIDNLDALNGKDR